MVSLFALLADQKVWNSSECGNWLIPCRRVPWYQLGGYSRYPLAGYNVQEIDDVIPCYLE